MSKVKHDYICKKCGKPATRNIQSTYHEYYIDNNGEMKEKDSWEGDTNEFYCDDCEID